MCKTRQSSLIFVFMDRRGPESVSNKPFASFHWVQHANEGGSARFKEDKSRHFLLSTRGKEVIFFFFLIQPPHTHHPLPFPLGSPLHQRLAWTTSLPLSPFCVLRDGVTSLPGSLPHYQGYRSATCIKSVSAIHKRLKSSVCFCFFSNVVHPYVSSS